MNPEWWFLKSYICLIPLGYLFCKAIKTNQNVWVDFFIVLAMDIIFQGLLGSVEELDVFSPLITNMYYDSFIDLNQYTTAFFAGIVFAKYDVISVIKRRILELLHTEFLGVLVLAVLFWCKGHVFDLNSDLIYCVLMIPTMSLLLDRCGFLKKICEYLGKHNTNIWLIHTFYCYYFLEVTQLVYCTRNIWVDLLILTVLSLGSSIALDGFYKTIGRLAGKLRRV